MRAERIFPARRARIAGIALAIAALSALAVGVTSAAAATREVHCGELQTALNEVAQDPHGGEGEVLVLSELCNAANLKSSNGVTLPAGSSFTIEGKPGAISGFNGAGINGPLLGTHSTEEAGTVSLMDLTFEHADLTEASALSIRAASVILNDDSFLENEEHGANAHGAFVEVGQSSASCPPTTGPAAITVTDSTFSRNMLTLGSGQGGGAGAWLQDECALSPAVVEGSAFEGNALQASATAEGTLVTGAGLRVVGNEAQPTPISQRANVFDSNRILATAPALANYGGGGEWLENVSLSSVDDRFSRNEIAGTESSSYERWSWGAGLGIDDLALACNSAEYPVSTLEDAVVAGNAIGPGMEADLGGGGVWGGCLRLRVLDSTVTLNHAPYGAGIEGEHGDQLEVVNSIVAGDSGGNEIDGFDESPGYLAATFSDICVTTSSNQPLPGAGNICADPLLADDGDPASFDVHETSASPTIDVGSNALAAGTPTTDFYGNQRVLSGRAYLPPCTPPGAVFEVLDPPVIDMGASEYGPIEVPQFAVVCVAKETPTPQPPLTPTTTETPPKPPATAITSIFSPPSLTVRSRGVLALAFHQLTAGRLRVRASFELARTTVTTIKGRHERLTKLQPKLYASATRTISSAGDVTIQLDPSTRALATLEHNKHLRVRLMIAFTTSGGAPLTRQETITVNYHARATGRHAGRAAAER